jgi:hypothetical protein
VVLDTARPSGQEISFRSAAEQSHTEPVMQVAWVSSKDAQRRVVHTIISMAGDGRVLSWGTPKEHKTECVQLSLIARLAVKGSDIRRTQKGSKAGSGTEAGLSALALFTDGVSDQKFVVGTESGGLLQCTLAAARPEGEVRLFLSGNVSLHGRTIPPPPPPTGVAHLIL